MEVIGAQLAMYRINAGLTQRELADRSTASAETIGSVEQGRRALMPHLATEFDQLRHLRTCAELPGVAIQVMPFGNTSHAGLSGPFVLLETADHQHLAYSETQIGSHLISAPDKVSSLTQKYGMLRMQALNA
ncbi:Scr1 family TA system antitoxin-like transcriptional regulator [Streptomyces angustmyceticus]|uniref:Scr1 family TA system antitoxin-like transcriptional regulator n=1 Tax=Streptomyces angustmyceticus TaxID=285578 RepID=UPI003D92A83C